MRPVFLMGNLKCAVSKEVISKPTNAQGARMTRLNTANPVLIPCVPKERETSPAATLGRHAAATATTPTTSTMERTVWRRCRKGFTPMNSTPTPASTKTLVATSPRYISFPAIV